MKNLLIIGFIITTLFGCGVDSQEAKDLQSVQQQQYQYAIAQPVPKYNWSLERALVSQLYDIRNQKAATHSVWRSNTGLIEGDCLSMGFSLPYDTSLTNPLAAVDFGRNEYDRHVVEQAEPNGIFASKNTSATWVLCVGDNGTIDPIYVESKVTVYPYPVNVSYENNRVIKAGKSSVNLSIK